MPYEKKMMQIFKSEGKTESNRVTHPCSKMGTLNNVHHEKWLFMWMKQLCGNCWNIPMEMTYFYTYKFKLKNSVKAEKMVRAIWSFSCREQTFILNILFYRRLHKFLISEDHPHVTLFSDRLKKNRIFTNIDIRNWSVGAEKTLEKKLH